MIPVTREDLLAGDFYFTGDLELVHIGAEHAFHEVCLSWRSYFPDTLPYFSGKFRLTKTAFIGLLAKRIDLEERTDHVMG